MNNTIKFDKYNQDLLKATTEKDNIFGNMDFENIDKYLDFTLNKSSAEMDLIDEFRFNNDSVINNNPQEIKKFNNGKDLSSPGNILITNDMVTPKNYDIVRSRIPTYNSKDVHLTDNEKKAETKDELIRRDEAGAEIIDGSIHEAYYERWLKTSLLKVPGGGVEDENSNIHAEVDKILRDLDINIDEQGSILFNTFNNSKYASTNRLLEDMIDTINTNNEAKNFSFMIQHINKQNEENQRMNNLSTIGNSSKGNIIKMNASEEIFIKKSEDTLIKIIENSQYNKNNEDYAQTMDLVQIKDVNVRKSKGCIIF